MTSELIAELFDLASYGAELKRELAAAGLSYRDAEKVIGVDHATLARVATATRPPNVENYLRIEHWRASRRSPAGDRAQGERQPPDAGVRAGLHVLEALTTACEWFSQREMGKSTTNSEAAIFARVDQACSYLEAALSAPVSEPSDADLDPSAPKAGPALKAFVAKGRRLLEPSDAVRGEAGEVVARLREWSDFNVPHLPKSFFTQAADTIEPLVRERDEAVRRQRELAVELTGARNSYADERRHVVALRQELSDLRAERGGERERLDRAEKALREIEDVSGPFDYPVAGQIARDYFASLSPVDGGSVGISPSEMPSPTLATGACEPSSVAPEGEQG